MKVRASRIGLGLVALLLLSGAPQSRAQGVPGHCVKNHLASVEEEGTALGIAPEGAKLLISGVARSIGISQEIAVVPCHFSSKALAWQAQGHPEVPDGEYIIYDPDWVREVVGDDQIEATALFGHELGHFVNRHFDSRRSITRAEKEREADHFAGCAVARLKGDFASLENLLSRLRREIDSEYPDRLTSIESARRGYIDCGGMKPDSTNPKEAKEVREKSPAVKPALSLLQGYAFFGIRSGNDWQERNFRILDKAAADFPKIGDTVVALNHVNARSGVIEWTGSDWVNKPAIGVIKPEQALLITEIQTVADGDFVWFKFVAE